MRKLTKLFSLLAVLAIASPVLAEDPKVTFSGMLDSYFSMNITNKSNDISGGTNGNFYAFNAKTDDYVLGLLEAGTKVVAGDATLNLTLMYGDTAQLLWLYNNNHGDLNLLNANVAITKDVFTFTFGKFATWMGNEVIESKNNMNYSRSILFFGIPALHTGLSIGVAPDAQFAATAYVVNGWNNQFSGDTDAVFGMEKTFGAQVKWMPADTGFSAILNGIYGPDTTGVNDNHAGVGELILAYTVDKFTFALDAQLGINTPWSATTIPHPHYYGAALYGKVALEDGWGVALRLEEVVNHNSDLMPGDASTDLIGYEYREVTLTIENQVTSNVLARLEGRMDMDVMDGDSTTAYAALDGNQITATAGLVFSF